MISSPIADDLSGMSQIPKPMFIQALVAETPIKAFDKAV